MHDFVVHSTALPIFELSTAVTTRQLGNRCHGGNGNAGDLLCDSIARALNLFMGKWTKDPTHSESMHTH